MDSSSDVLSPQYAAKFITDQAKDVKLCLEKIDKVTKVVLEGLQAKNFQLANWKSLDINPKVANEIAIDWIFFLDALNFSFWTDDSDGHFTVTYNQVPYTGYFGLCAAVCNALKSGINLIDPHVYANITKKELKSLFCSDSGKDIPLLEERYEILQETGNVLLKKFGGTFVNCLLESKNSAQNVIKLVVTHFPSFRDEALYENKRVAFYKRVQILIADIWACFEGQGLGYFSDIDTLTMFADYRVPQVLAHFGLLQYSDKLLKQLQDGTRLESQSNEEIEIRGCTIMAVEHIKEAVHQMIAIDPDVYDSTVPINSIMIDFFLWEYRRKHATLIDETPFHRVRSIYY